MLVRDAYYSETVLHPDEDGVDLGWVARDADRGDGHITVVYDLEIAGSELEGVDVSGLGVKLTLSPDELKEKAILSLLPYQKWPKVMDTLTYMRAEDWHDKLWQQFIDYNLKMDTLQRGELLEACPEFKGYIND